MDNGGIEPNESEDLTLDNRSILFFYKFIEFLAQKNISLSNGDEIITFFKNQISDSSLLKNTNIYRKKTGILLNHGIKNLIHESLDLQLQDKFWSLIVDECTDGSKTKFLALVVQHWSPKKGSECFLYRMVDCSKISTSQEIFDMLGSLILQKPIGKNLVAFASDGASVMRGRNNSVLEKLKKKVSKYLGCHCLSHCFHLILNYASKALPLWVELFIKQIYNHFSNSALRTSNWIQLQETMNMKPHKILRSGQTRWCSVEASINRILEKWDALLKYFEETKTDDSINILKDMKNPETKVYLGFLKIYLKKINELNLRFQKRLTEVGHIQLTIQHFFNSIINLLLKDEFKNMPFEDKLNLVTKDKELDLMQIDEKLLKNIEEFAAHLEKYFDHVIPLSSIEDVDQKLDLVSYLQQFLMRLLYKSQKKLPFQDRLLNLITSLFPNNFKSDDVMLLAESFKNIIPDQEFHSLYEEIDSFSADINNMKKLFDSFQEDIVKFYSDEKVSVGYPLLTKLATTLLSFPHSTAEVERVFSQLKLTKTDHRTNLYPETVEALMLNKYYSLDFENDEIKNKAIKKYDEITKQLNEQTKSNTLKRKKSNMSPCPNGEDPQNDYNLQRLKFNGDSPSTSSQNSVTVDLSKKSD